MAIMMNRAMSARPARGIMGIPPTPTDWSAALARPRSFAGARELAHRFNREDRIAENLGRMTTAGDMLRGMGRSMGGGDEDEYAMGRSTGAPPMTPSMAPSMAPEGMNIMAHAKGGVIPAGLIAGLSQEQQNGGEAGADDTGGLATGAGMKRKVMHLVGEKGRELLVPRGDGGFNVLTNPQTEQVLQGASTVQGGDNPMIRHCAGGIIVGHAYGGGIEERTAPSITAPYGLGESGIVIGHQSGTGIPPTASDTSTPPAATTPAATIDTSTPPAATTPTATTPAATTPTEGGLWRLVMPMTGESYVPKMPGARQVMGGPWVGGNGGYVQGPLPPFPASDTSTPPAATIDTPTSPATTTPAATTPAATIDTSTPPASPVPSAEEYYRAMARRAMETATAKRQIPPEQPVSGLERYFATAPGAVQRIRDEQTKRMERQAEIDQGTRDQRASNTMAWGTDAERTAVLHEDTALGRERLAGAAGLERERLTGAAGLERERLANAGTMERERLAGENAMARTQAEIEAKAALGKYTSFTDTFGTPIGTLNANTGELKHFPEIQAKHRADELIAQIGTDAKPVKYITAYHLNQLNALPLEEQKAFLARYQEQNPKQYEKLKQSFKAAKAASGGAQ